MKITIGRNEVPFETSIFSIQIMLSKKRSICFSIQKPCSLKSFMKALKKSKKHEMVKQE